MVVLIASLLLTSLPEQRIHAATQLTPLPDWKAELLGTPVFLPTPTSGDDADNNAGSPPPSNDQGATPPQVAPNVRVNGPQALFPAGLLGRSETTIGVAGNGKLLAAGWNDARGFLHAPFNIFPGTPGLSGSAFSTNGGNTWTEAGPPFITGAPDPNNPTCGDIVTRGDPWIDTNSFGSSQATIFYANLAVHQSAACATAFNGIPAGVSVHRGSFFTTSGGTLSFGWNDVRLLQAVPGVGLSAGFPLDFYDKESLAADKLRPNVFMAVTNFVGLAPSTQGCGFGQIELWHSFDGGNTWASPPTLVQIDQVQTTPAVDCSSGRLNQGPSEAVAPNGDVYVAWQNGPDFSGGFLVFPLDVSIRVARCINFGAGPCTTILNEPINSLRRSTPQGYNRNRQNDFPRIAVADQNSNNPGRVLVTYHTGTGTPLATSVFPESNILVKFTDNAGATWNGPFNVNPPSDGRKNFWPVVNTGDGGVVSVVWYSSAETNITPDPNDIECIPGGKQAGGGISQNGKLSSLVDVFIAQSLDGGKTWETPVKVTSVTSNWCKARTNIRPTFGDYIDAKGFGNTIFVVWADARIAAPLPDSLAPPAGPRTQESDTFYATVTLFDG